MPRPTAIRESKEDKQRGIEREQESDKYEKESKEVGEGGRGERRHVREVDGMRVPSIVFLYTSKVF